MVFDTLFKCDICDDTVFRLRIQCDDSIRKYPLPLSIICPECGNAINLTFSSNKGILPKAYKVDDDKIDSANIKYDVPYSPQLPITTESIVSYRSVVLSPYLSLYNVYRPDVISKHATQAKTILDNIYPYRHSIIGLLPIYKKGNIKAFSKKLAMEMDIKSKFHTLVSISACRSALFDLVRTTYNNIATAEYIRQIRQPFLNIIRKEVLIQNAGALLPKLKDILDLHDWQDKSINWIGWMVNKCEKYLTSLFYLSVGDFRDHHIPNAVINSISFDEAQNDYNESFDFMKEILPLLVGIANWGITGDFDNFPNMNGGMKGIGNVENYSKIPEGLMMDKIADYPQILSFLCGGINTNIRNGIAHNRFDINRNTQNIIYYPRANDNTYHYDIQLIDMCYLTIINLLHVMEFNLFLEELKKHK